MGKLRCAPLLDDFYRQFLEDQDAAALVDRVLGRYNLGTIERLASHSQRVTRRAAVLLLGLVGNAESNAVLGRALCDADRRVRMLAEDGIRLLWSRGTSPAQTKRLAALLRLNASQRYRQAVRHAGQLVETAPELAEAWNQRAIAHFALGEYHQSIADCRQTLELNGYHFGAAAGMGQCYLQLGNPQAALEAFRQALRLNPGLEAIRASVLYLQRTLNNQDY